MSQLMLRLVLLLLLLLHPSFPRANLSCSSLQGVTTRPGPSCLLPFRLEGRLYITCTTSFQPSKHSLPRHLLGRPLCPTSSLAPLTLEAPSDPSFWAPCSSSCLLTDYRTNQQLVEDLESLASLYPGLASLSVLGPSLEGLPLTALTLGTRRSLAPRVRLYSGLAGDQTTGRELLAHTAAQLLHSYGKDPRITAILDTTTISLLPAANPDGFARATKGSCSGARSREGERNGAAVSLETDFPTAEDYARFQADPDYDPYQGRQPETQALMAWSVDSPWMLGLHLQDGAVAVTYPPHQGGSEQVQEQELRHLGEVVAASTDLDRAGRCYYRWQEGLASGLEWQQKFEGKRGAGRGCVEDFSLLFTDSLELRLAVSCCKYPVRFSLVREWETHQETILAFLEEAQRGVRGVVYLPDSSPAPGVDLVFWGPEGRRSARNTTSSSEGQFWRYLLPADRHYTLQGLWEDCQGSGRRFASPQLQVVVTEERPAVTRVLVLRHVGWCAGVEVPESFRDVVDSEGIFRRGDFDI